MRRFAATVKVYTVLALVLFAPAPAWAAEPFRTALEAHLKAVAAHDMEALLPTLTGEEALTMITPLGERLETRDAYIEFHRRWFSANDPQERLDFAIERVIETPALAHALVRLTYTSSGVEGKAQTYTGWLTLTFAIEDDRWALVFDQNTPIIAADQAQSE